MLDRVGVRTRIIVGSVAIVTVVLAILGIVVWRAMSTAISATAYETAAGTLASISNDLRRDPPTQAVPPDVQPDGHRVQQVLDANGTVLAYSNRIASSGPIVTFDPLPGIGEIETMEATVLESSRGPSLIAATRVEDPNGKVLTVLVAEPIHIEPNAAQRLMLVGLTTVLAAIIVLALVLRHAVGSALDPVERMRQDLELITSSRDSRPVAAPDRDDEIGRLGRSINALLERLRRSDEERAAFVSDAGHELRSPLTTIGISIDLLGSDLSSERRATVAERARGELTRLTGLTEDLLSLAKADEWTQLVGATELDLDDIVLGEVGVARAKGANVELHLAPARVTGVQDQVRRVVRNLVDNAMRHAVSTIRIGVRERAGRAELLVDNDGPPIAVEDRQRVFDRFVRLDESRDRDQGGSGLGLAIVQQIVLRHGGEVEATEAEDGWCRFRVSLPVLEDSYDLEHELLSL